MPCALCEYGDKVVDSEDQFVENHIRYALAKHFDIAEEEVTVEAMSENGSTYEIVDYRHLGRREVTVDGKVVLVFKRLGTSLKAYHSD